MGIIRITTEKELEGIHVESFINNSGSKVTKVSDESVLRGLIRGNTKTAKKALKDIALAVSHLFPDSAYGTTLDEVAENSGIAPRFGAAQSSTFVRVIADEGTIYQQGVHVVSDNKGNSFDLQEDITIGSKGYGYVKVRSQQAGSSSNVDPYTIVNMSPEPSGHVGVINEYSATGGYDQEDDDQLRQRIKEGPDLLARGTISYLTQAFIKANPNVLRVIYEGVSSVGKVVLAILTVNGIDLTQDELDDILSQSGEYFSLTELNPIGTQSYGVELKNANYYSIDVEMRVELINLSLLSETVIDIQQKFSKSVDFRFWNNSSPKIEWDDLLTIVKNNSNIKYVQDQYFVPNLDITIPTNNFPRFRGFVMRDLQGNILIDQAGEIDPIYYSSDGDRSFIETVL